MGFGYSGGQVEWKRNRAQAISSLLRVRTCSLPSAVCNYTHEEVLGLHISFQILVLLSENGPVLSCEVQKVRFAMAMTLILIANMLKCLVDLPHISTLPCCHWPLKHCPLPRVEHLLHASLSLSLINIELSGSGLCWIGPGSNTTRWKMRLLNTIRLQEHLDTILGEKVLCSMCC